MDATDTLNEIIRHRTEALQADLEKARQVQNELCAALDSAKKTIAQMEQARRDRDDRWAYLLGENKKSLEAATRENASLKLEVESLRNHNTQPQQPDIQP